MEEKTPTLRNPTILSSKGIHRILPLPDPSLGALWNSIIAAETQKSQLLSQAMLNFTLRGKVDRSVLPLHGVILQLRLQHDTDKMFLLCNACRVIG